MITAEQAAQLTAAAQIKNILALEAIEKKIEQQAKAGLNYTYIFYPETTTDEIRWELIEAGYTVENISVDIKISW